jgi:hypothetical protein
MYKKINTVQFRKENPKLYSEIKKEYAPIFDMWVAIAMKLAGDPPPICIVCGGRIRVAVKNLKTQIHADCRYHKQRYTHKQAINKIPDLITTWIGLAKQDLRIIRRCNRHGDWSQLLSSAIAGHGCQKCHTDKLKGLLKYTTKEWTDLAKKSTYW